MPLFTRRSVARLSLLAFAGGALSAPALAASGAATQAPPPASASVYLGNIVVTGTPMPERLATVPKSITVVTHEQLVSMGATDLRSALALVGGVYIAPGGDGGPAGSVPQFQGLQEFDAFLLLVDGVPWGGAFNPDLPSIDLNDVARIEVIRGAAPVKYGATAFVGVINIIHRRAGDPTHTLSASLGSWDSGNVAFSSPLPSVGPLRQSIAVDAARQGMRDYRAGYDREHFLYRGAVDTATGTFHFDFDALQLQQQPQSPIPLSDAANGLSPVVPLDSNQNPSNAEMNTERYNLVAGYDTAIGAGTWSTTLSTTFQHQRNVRGFLRADAFMTGGAPNADGFNQSVSNNDMYFDTHYEYPIGADLKMVTGFNYLYGWGQQNSDNYEYYVNPDGANPPNSNTLHVDEQTQLTDRRSFLGAYSEADWKFAPRWDFLVGVRLNHTLESRDASLWPSPDSGQSPDHSSQSQTNTRFSGVLALSRTLQDDTAGHVVAYVNYGNTFKPAAVDFGPEAEGGILQPETAQSYQGGVKGYAYGSGLGWNVNLFWVNFSNVVIPASEGGLPGTQNGGQQRLRGIEGELDGPIASDWRWTVTYAYHDAQYTNFVVNENGRNVQLAGNQIVMSPHQLFKAGIGRTPDQGWLAYANVEIVGPRYYDMDNQIQAPGYGTLNAGVGYRFGGWTVRLDGTNLTNRRPAVAESELGPDSFYVMPARSVQLSAALSW